VTGSSVAITNAARIIRAIAMNAKRARNGKHGLGHVTLSKENIQRVHVARYQVFRMHGVLDAIGVNAAIVQNELIIDKCPGIVVGSD
jgi:hypothetical protein